MSRTRIIIVGIAPEDFVLVARAVSWLIAKPATQKDAILSYGAGLGTLGSLDLYVRRNKSSITVSKVQS